MRTTIKNIDYTTRDYEGFRSLMLEQLQVLMPEYTDLRQSDAGVVILELNAMCLDILSYYLDSVANECFLATAEQRSSVMKFCKMLGYTPRTATSAKFKQIFVKTNKDVALTIPKGTKVKTVSSNPNLVVYFTTLEDFTLEAGVKGDEVDSETGKYLHTVDVIQGLFVNNELITDNSQNARSYSLKYEPVLIEDSYTINPSDPTSQVILLAVYVSNTSQGEASARWNRVNSFAGADSTSQVYMIETNDYNESSIVFGDGSFGKFPSTGSLITCSYVVGGGSRGNVGLGSVKALEDNLSGIERTENVEIIEYGSDAESIDEIRVNAPMSQRNIWGALTVKDFAGVIKVEFPDVQDAEAKRASDDWSNLAIDDIKIYLLSKEEVSYAKENHLRYIPVSAYSSIPHYSDLIGDINAFFDSDTDYVDIGNNTQKDGARKLAGVRDVILTHPTYKQIVIDYTLMVRNYYDITTIIPQVEQYIYDYFAVGNTEFGQEISLQELAYQIIDKSGIEGIRYLSLKLYGLTLDENGEYSDSAFSYLNNDLLVPKTGTLFACVGLEHHYPDNPELEEE